MNAPVSITPQLEYSSAIQAFLARQQPAKLFINNEWVASESSTLIDVLDPATATQIAAIPDATNGDVDRAVAAAREAFEGAWSQATPADRQRLLWKISDLIEANGPLFAELESIDNGKPKTFASIVDIGGTVEYFRYMSGWATKIEGSTFETSLRGAPGQTFTSYSRREPVGVVGQIVPWNFPLAMAAWKIAPALAAGCTVVIKPAEQTPLTLLLLCDIIKEAGVPAGVVNVVTGYGATVGSALTTHPGIDKIAFTGSTNTGKIINKAATDSLKRVSLELGGKSPVIVLDDADIETVVGGCANAIFFNSGQVCTAGSRLFVQRKLFEQVVEGISGAAAGIPMGPGLDANTIIGPLVSERQQQRVMGYIEAGKAEGATIRVGGEAVDHPGYFVRPTVMTDVRPGMKVVDEEIFGPVLCAQVFDDLDEVAAMANNTDFGLAASIWSNNLKAVNTLVPRIQAGTVWVNTHNMIDPAMPFGGFKQSGIGREHGRVAIELYTENKSVCMAN